MTKDDLFNGIEHVTIAAKDPKALAKWYCSTLSFKIAYESTRSLTTYVRLGESLLEIIESEDIDKVSHSERESGFRHMAISVTDIDKAFKNLSSRGITFKSEPREKEGVWTVFLEDPEHNLLHLIQRHRPL